jgi:F0F1-type ATP synthase assembly protein I
MVSANKYSYSNGNNYFSFFGKWLDERFPNTSNIYIKIFVLLGVGLALYNVIRQVNQLNKND